MTEQRGDELVRLRAEMTEATEAFVAAFNLRGQKALAIAAEKARRGRLQVRDAAREAEVLDYAAAINPGPFSEAAVRRIVQVAMDESSRLQAEAQGLPLGDLPGQPVEDIHIS